jgi:hypothetical protein
MIRLVAALLLVGYVPGAVLMRVPLGDRARREALDAGERAFWAIVLSAIASLVIALGLALVVRYTFQRLLLADGLASAAPILIWRGRLRYRAAARPGFTLLIPLALVGGALWLYPPPAEYVIGGKDPGVYLNAGVQIAQQGRLVMTDQTARAVPAGVRPLFFPKYAGQVYYSLRFMGFFLLDPDTGEVVDQFPHLYPVAIAIGYGAAGLTGAREASVAAAIVGVLALYFLGARLAGRAIGAAAAALLAIHVIEVWYARYPNSEMLSQAIGLAGLLALARANVDDDGFFAPVAGVLLGMLPFARFDAVLVTGLATGAVLLQWLAGDRLRWAFLAPLALLSVAFAVYLSGWVAPYAAVPRFWIDFHRVQIAVGVGAGLVALAAASRLRRRQAVRTWMIAWMPRLLLATALALAAYAWFLRHPGGALSASDAYAFRTFGWYVPPAAIAAAAIGLAILMLTRFWTDPAFFVVFIGMATFVFYRPRIVPEHFWAARRFVPIILPGMVLAIAAALVPAWNAAPLARHVAVAMFRHALRIVLLALVAWSFWTATTLIRDHVECAGIIPRLERLASRFGPDDLLVVESRNASDLHVLALPLAYIYAKPVLLLNTPKPDSVTFAEFLRWARAKYRNVYFLGGGGTDLLSREVAVEPVGSERFQVPEYESLANAYPTHVRYKEFDFGIYRFIDPVGHSEGLSVDIGEMDDLYVVRFHAKERDERGTFRWTRGQSYLSLVGVTADARELVLWMENGGRPPKAAPASVEVFFGETSLGKVVVGKERREYVFDIPPALAVEAAASVDAVTVRLISATWNPRELTGSSDDRDLGVMVDRVEVRRVTPTR